MGEVLEYARSFLSLIGIAGILAVAIKVIFRVAWSRAFDLGVNAVIAGFLVWDFYSGWRRGENFGVVYLSLWIILGVLILMTRLIFGGLERRNERVRKMREAQEREGSTQQHRE